MLEARSEEEAQQISQTSREIVKETLEMQGFIGWMGMIVGHRMMTVAAWETPEDPRQDVKWGHASRSRGQVSWPRASRRRHD